MATGKNSTIDSFDLCNEIQEITLRVRGTGNALRMFSLPDDDLGFMPDALRDAVRVACRDKVSSSALGYWLRAHRDRIVDGMHIEHAGEHGRSKVSRWKVVSSISSK